MNVLFVNTLYSEYRIGGAEISVQNLAEQLCKDGYTVGVIAIGEENKFFILNGVKVWILKIQNIYWPFHSKEVSLTEKLRWHFKDISNDGYNASVIQIFNEFNPDVVHTNNLSGISVKLWNLAQNSNIKIVHTLRDYYLFCPKITMYKNNKCCKSQCLECNILSVNKKWASKNIDYVVGISNYILELHKKMGYFKHSKAQIIYNGFKLEGNNKRPSKYSRESHINIGFIGQINSSKGIELLFKALGLLTDYSNWTLHVAGNIKADEKENLRTLGKFNDRVIFQGYVPVEQFLESIDLMVVPSLWQEPFGRVVLEGIINKTPVLASKRGGIPELLKNNKSFLFEPHLLELKKVLIRIINDATILNSFKFDIDEKFRIENTISRYKQIYLNVTEKYES